MNKARRKEIAEIEGLQASGRGSEMEEKISSIQNAISSISDAIDEIEMV